MAYTRAPLDPDHQAITLSIDTFTDQRAVYAWYLDAALAYLDACACRPAAVSVLELLLEARVGLSEGELRQLVGIPQAARNPTWAVIKAVLRPLVADPGGRFTIGHDTIAAAARAKLQTTGQADEKLAKFFFAACKGAGQFPPIQARLRDERPHLRFLRQGMVQLALQLLANENYAAQLCPNGELRCVLTPHQLALCARIPLW